MPRAHDLLQAIIDSRLFPDLVIMREMRIGCGHGQDAERYLDGWGISLAQNKAHRSVTFEVKCSRSDYKRELAQPAKRRWAVMHSNEYYFVTPPGLVDSATLPVECGLIEVTNGRTINVVTKAPHRDRCRVPWRFVAGLARRCARSEGCARDHGKF